MYGVLFLHRFILLVVTSKFRRVQVPVRSKKFLFSVLSRLALRPTKPPIQWVTGTLPLRVKQLESEADHSPPTSAEVKETWIYTSIPSHVFMA
jgi:hypothetical protein